MLDVIRRARPHELVRLAHLLADLPMSEHARLAYLDELLARSAVLAPDAVDGVRAAFHARRGA